MRSGDNYREPPDLTGKELDFSQFHPFDHSVFSHRCTELYGGRRNHLQMKWEFVWSQELRARTVCLIGWHQSTSMFRMRDGKPYSVRKVCTNCGKPLSNDQPV